VILSGNLQSPFGAKGANVTRVWLSRSVRG